MISIPQMRSVLLEETILMLLRAAGYRTVLMSPTDPTLECNGTSLRVKGRGSSHQIDAIADLRIGLPFSHPQRLLVEAKSYDKPVGLEDVRNLVGVLKDVSEFWIGHPRGAPARSRYHYQAAIFSTSGFTQPAQNYAFAHDIYLFPLARSSHFRPVIEAIDVAVTEFSGQEGKVTAITLVDLRNSIRRRLQPRLSADGEGQDRFGWLEPVARAALLIGQSLVAVVGRAFPVFLTPGPGADLASLCPLEQVTIHFGDRTSPTGWAIRRQSKDTALFTFDVPDQLFGLYAEGGCYLPRLPLT